MRRQTGDAPTDRLSQRPYHPYDALQEETARHRNNPPPLDGCAFAQQALQVAGAIARRTGAALTLIRLHQPPMYGELSAWKHGMRTSAGWKKRTSCGWRYVYPTASACR